MIVTKQKSFQDLVNDRVNSCRNPIQEFTTRPLTGECIPLDGTLGAISNERNYDAPISNMQW